MATSLPHYQPLESDTLSTTVSAPGSRQFNVTFRKPDRLQVISNCGSGPLHLVKRAVYTAYPPGLTSVKDKRPDAWTLKLSGSPFARGSATENATLARVLACELAAASMREGWQLVTAPIVNNVRDAATWFFRSAGGEPATAADAPDCCCLMLTQSNGIRFIRFPTELADQVCNLVFTDWPDDVLTLPFVSGQPPIELRLSGAPWTAQKANGVAARRLILRLVELMKRRGWALLTSARVKDSSDSLFFCRVNGKAIDSNPAGAPASSDMMLLSLHNKQTVRLEGSDPDVYGPWLAETLSRLWHRGVVSHGNYFGAVDVRLGGSPWLPCDRDTKSLGRQLMTRLLAELRSRGWRVLHTVDISRLYPVTKSAFLLIKSDPESLPHCCFWVGVSSRISFVDVPESLLQTLVVAVRGSCGDKLASHKAKPYAYQLKFRDMGCGSIEWRRLLDVLMNVFAAARWELVCTGNVSGRYYSDNSHTYSLEVHSWWFARVSSANPKYLEAAAGDAASSEADGQWKSSPTAPLPPTYDSLFGPPPSPPAL